MLMFVTSLLFIFIIKLRFPNKVSIVTILNATVTRTFLSYKIDYIYIYIYIYIYRRFNAIVSQLKMHYFSGGAFES